MLTYNPTSVKFSSLLADIILAVDQGDSPDSKFPDRKGEYWALCPFHPDSHAGNFSVSEKGYKCFSCGAAGGLQALAAHLGLQPGKPQGEAERAAWFVEKERRLTEGREKARSVLEKLQHKRPDLIYYSNLNGQAETVMRTWGLTQETVDLFKIGYCSHCPTSPDSDSFTIPYYHHTKVINLRHRLIKPNGQGKYRPEAAGLPATIFNADLLDSEKWIVLVEGEFKAMVLTQYGLPAIAIPGVTAFKEDWAQRFSQVDKAHVCLDWGTETQARRIGGLLSQAGVDVWLVTLPVAKPDDFFVAYGGTVRQFCKYLESGRKV